MREYVVDPMELSRVADIMTRRVERLSQSLPVTDVVAFFTSTSADADPRHRHAGYPVVDDDERVVGVVTRSDIIRLTRDGWDGGTRLSDVMSTDPIVGRPGEPVARLAERMAAAGVGRAPIVGGGGALTGIVTRRDLLRARSHAARSEATWERVLAARLPRRRPREA